MSIVPNNRFQDRLIREDARLYSGKKKRYTTTVKNQLMVNNHRGYILHKVAYKKGKRHDYTS
ncbi:MAG TPA: hypothetical protein VN703_06210, partial [Candidatus Sulfopaludibacter sp.]|nr:hypothetical protein [Candidatus Sulfopaludibacter sp.]